VVSLLAPQARSWGTWLGDQGRAPELEQRLRDVTARHESQVQHPDQFWLYRKTMKEQLIKHPRSTIRLVSGEVPRRELDAQDQRRLDYFQALDAAARDPVPARIQELAAFERCSDPLISYYVHHEVATLWSRAPQRDVREELSHRLHGIYFASPGDRSLRDVIATLELLCEHPEAVPDPGQRWDHLNSLLQMLLTRWQNRSTAAPTSTRIVLNDIDQSILAMETAFTKMDALAAEAGVPAGQWQHRRQWMERALVRPLRTYRSRILPHQDQEQKRDGTSG
jgi:hypothetical protein